MNEKLLEAAKPLIEYLVANHPPHVTAIVTGNKIELLVGLARASTNEFNRVKCENIRDMQH